MRAIWKYPVHVGSKWTVEVPLEARFRSLQIQRGEPQMWLEVDPRADKESITFRTVATGEEFDEEGKRYLGTFQVYSGDLVFHLFVDANKAMHEDPPRKIA